MQLCCFGMNNLLLHQCCAIGPQQRVVLLAARSESEYYGTPQASPDEHSSRTPGQGLHDQGFQAQPHASSEARRQLNLSEPSQGTSQQRALHQPYSSSQRSGNDRDLDYTDSFQTARSTTSEAPNAGSTGVLGSVLETVGLSGKDYVDGAEAKQTEPEGTGHTGTNTNSSSTGVLGALKSAVGLGNSSTSATSHSGGRYSNERPAWATAGATEAPVRAQSPVRQADSFDGRNSGQQYEETDSHQRLSQPQATSAIADNSQLSRSSPTRSDTQEHKYGQPQGESEVDQNLSGPQQTSQYNSSFPSRGNADSVQTHGQGVSTVDKLKSAVGLGSSPTASNSPTISGRAFGTATSTGSASQSEPVQEHRYGQPYAESDRDNAQTAFQSQGPISSSNQVADSSISQPTQAGTQDMSYGQASRGSDLSQQEHGSRYGSSSEPTTQDQDTGVLGKLKAAVGMGGAADTEGVSRSDWSTSHNPTFDSDTPRSGVAGSTAFTEPPQQLTKRLSDAPPSASWGSSAQTATYAPAETLSHGAYPSSAGSYQTDAHSQQGYTGNQQCNTHLRQLQHAALCLKYAKLSCEACLDSLVQGKTLVFSCNAMSDAPCKTSSSLQGIPSTSFVVHAVFCVSAASVLVLRS